MSRNVILIILDTVRKDVFDEYAEKLSSLSDTSFSQCRTVSSWSVPSHTSMFTGTLPNEHGIHGESIGDTTDFSSLSVSETFLDELSDHTTLGISANPYVNSLFGFDTLFDEFTDMIETKSLFADGLSPYEHSMSDRLGDGTSGYLRTALEHNHPIKSIANLLWSAAGESEYPHPFPGVIDDGGRAISDYSVASVEATEEPFFLFTNYMDAHTPFRNLIYFDQDLHSVPNTWNSNELHQWDYNKEGDGDETYLRNYRELYGASVEYLDRIVAKKIKSISETTEDETTFIITSDHGHNLGYPAEDGLIHHISSTSEAVLHAPFEIINPPEKFPETVDSYFSHLGLGELITDIAADQPFDPRLLDRPVVAETISLGGTGDPRNYRDFEDGEFEYWNRMIRCFYYRCSKYQWDSVGQRLKYRLDSSRPSWQELESEDVPIPDKALDGFSVSIEDFKSQVSSETHASIDSGVEDALKDLGYL